MAVVMIFATWAGPHPTHAHDVMKQQQGQAARIATRRGAAASIRPCGRRLLWPDTLSYVAILMLCLASWHLSSAAAAAAAAAATPVSHWNHNGISIGS
jgi:hypothetical protein